MTHTPSGLPADLQAQGLTLSPDFVDPASAYYPEGDVTGGLPITLDSLRDGPPGSKPFYPYSTLIRYAIKGSPAGKLLLEDIYYAIESRFPYFRAAPAGWKNSVRHNLSLNPCFVKVPRPLTDRGKGSYWTVDDNVDPRTGVHRVRKKKTRKGSKGDPQDDAAATALDVFEGFDPSGVARAQQHMDDLHAAFGPTALDEHGQPRVAGFPGTALPFAFDPAYQMQLLGMSLAQAPEQLPVDATGNIDWRMAWHNELASLQRVTAEQDKAPASNEEWYRAMFFRLRAGIFNPFPNDLFGPTAAQPSPMGMDQDPVAQMGTPPDGPGLPS